MALLRVGRIAGVFGVLGELKIDPTTSGAPLYVVGAIFIATLADGSRREIALETVREHKNRLLARLVGVQGAHVAEQFVGAEIFAERERVVAELDADEVLDADLIGLAVVEASGKSHGHVRAVEHMTGSSMLILEPGGRYLPYVKHFVKATDLLARTIVVEVPPGLLDDDAEIDAP